MPLIKFLPKPGMNQENTRYTAEGGWWDGDKVRFRQGTPESIGGWARISGSTFIGACRSLWAWVTLGGSKLVGVGTNLKFYIQRGGQYYDITPVRATATLTDPFTATNGSSIITVADTAHGALVGAYVTFSGAVGLGGTITAGVLNREYPVASVVDASTYTIDVGVAANATDVTGSPGGGAAVSAAYQINVGAGVDIPLVGFGAGSFGDGVWGTGGTSAYETRLRLWTQYNYGEYLIFTPRGGKPYIWDASSGTTTRATAVEATVGASDVPTSVLTIIISDTSRFAIALGCNELGSSTLDPMLIRWSDQEQYAMWTPAITNQAGDIRLSIGSEIVTGIQVRQEIAVLTDSALYALQYLGPPYVWGSQLLGDNISIISPRAAVVASGVLFWMGVDKFYVYDGRVQTLDCNLLRSVYGDLNTLQVAQIFCGTNEGYNEVWWFFCSADSADVDRYVVYNYAEKLWYQGTMARTAWIDNGMNGRPLAATYSHNLVEHEVGVDDVETATPAALNAYISSSEFDIGDGHNFGFIWRAVPDLTFRGATEGTNPEVTLTIYPMLNSGSGTAAAVSAGVVKGASYIVPEEFTGQVGMRVRGRQMVFKIGANKVGTAWQLGATRLDVRQDGRR